MNIFLCLWHRCPNPKRTLVLFLVVAQIISLRTLGMYSLLIFYSGCWVALSLSTIVEWRGAAKGIFSQWCACSFALSAKGWTTSHALLREQATFITALLLTR